MSLALGAAVAASTVAAALHTYMFVRESLLFSRTGTQQMLEVAATDVPAVRLWAFHQGVYNLLLGATALAGGLATVLGSAPVGTTLLTASGVTMLVAAVALIAVDRRPARLPGFLAQALPAAVMLVAVGLGG